MNLYIYLTYIYKKPHILFQVYVGRWGECKLVLMGVGVIPNTKATDQSFSRTMVHEVYVTIRHRAQRGVGLRTQTNYIRGV